MFDYFRQELHCDRQISTGQLAWAAMKAVITMRVTLLMLAVSGSIFLSSGCFHLGNEVLAGKPIEKDELESSIPAGTSKATTDTAIVW